MRAVDQAGQLDLGQAGLLPVVPQLTAEDTLRSPIMIIIAA
ncbi:MAG TPA: hypothetical protein VGH27_23275 [Streptosporangiaceae bacterium]